MTITIKKNQKIQNLQIIDNIYIYICVCVCARAHARVTTQQRNIRERYVTIKRIIQMLKPLKGQKILKNHNMYFL